MDIEYRRITPDEFVPFHRASARSFGEHVPDEVVEIERKIFDFEGSVAAVAGDRFVGTGVLFPLRLTVPGELEIAAGGVSWISVQPDFRRRGILTEIMRRQFQDTRERGEALAILWASESVIYGRFGYGMATTSARYSIDTSFRRMSRGIAASGRVRLIEKIEAQRILPELYEQMRGTQPGAVTMLPGWWDHYFTDPEPWWQGASPRWYVVYENALGQPEGYAAYRTAPKWLDGFAAGTLRLMALQTETAHARAALWQYVLNVDLMATVETHELPIDEPLRLQLADPRRLRTMRYTDGLWVRLVDIQTALAGRRYRVPGEVVLGVTDPFLPENTGSYLLSGGPDGAECCRTDRDADLALEISDVSAAYLGGTSLRSLAEAGRVKELTAGALARANLMFSGDRTPYTAQQF